jgi:hypothetical protein
MDALLFHKAPVADQFNGGDPDSPRLVQVTLASTSRQVFRLRADGSVQQFDQAVGGAQSVYWRWQTGTLLHRALTPFAKATLLLPAWAATAAAATGLNVRDFVFVELSRDELRDVKIQVEGPPDGSDPDTIAGRQKARHEARIDALRSTLAGMLHVDGAVPVNRKVLTISDDPAQRRREYKALKFLVDRYAGNVFVDD